MFSDCYILGLCENTKVLSLSHTYNHSKETEAGMVMLSIVLSMGMCVYTFHNKNEIKSDKILYSHN